jgi:hypothetical protein
VSAHVRLSDPETSRDAAVSMLPVFHVELQRVLRAAEFIDLMTGDGATAWQIKRRLASQGIEREQGSVARRCTDLRDLGLIVDSGERRRGRTGRLLIVWTLTPEGHHRLQEGTP